MIERNYREEIGKKAKAEEEKKKEAKAIADFEKYKEDPEYIKLQDEEKELNKQLKELNNIDTSKLTQRALSTHEKKIDGIKTKLRRNESDQANINLKYRTKYNPLKNKRRR
jgi:hypothetical protein